MSYLLGVVPNARDVPALTPIDSNQVSKQMHMPLGNGMSISRKERRDTLLQLVPRDLDAVVVIIVEIDG